MISVLHVIDELGAGGASRAMLAAAVNSREQAAVVHMVASLRPPSQIGLRLAGEAGVEVVPQGQLLSAIEAADVVQLQWWNNPQMDELLSSALPAARLLAWCHVGGQAPPHVIPRDFLDKVDMIVACSPFTYKCDGIQAVPAAQRFSRTGMIYGATDFRRLQGIQLRPHAGFNVGYIGTVDFLKMHPEFVKMSCSIAIPEARFVVCGGGRAEAALRSQAAAAGASGRFDIRGHIEDIRPVIESFDVYGYPLCEETYAASEMNLQEVMFAGIPPVVFPYGGVKDLIIDNFTGLIVRSPAAYKEAIEFLYREPAERARIGRNAREYASSVFDARKVGGAFNDLYARMMREPKRPRAARAARSGAQALLESLDGSLPELLASHGGREVGALLEAEAKIASCSEVLRVNGLEAYRDHYPNDPHLRLWNGLAYLGRGAAQAAASELIISIQLGLNHWRLFWYLAQAAVLAGDRDAARTALGKVLEVQPGYEPAREMLSRI